MELIYNNQSILKTMSNFTDLFSRLPNISEYLMELHSNNIISDNIVQLESNTTNNTTPIKSSDNNIESTFEPITNSTLIKTEKSKKECSRKDEQTSRKSGSQTIKTAKHGRKPQTVPSSNRQSRFQKQSSSMVLTFPEAG